LNATLRVLEECFKEGRTIKLREFGTFRVITLNRTINSPLRQIELKDYKTLRFKPSKKLIRKLNSLT
ncbi:MAG: HU family DNA-binding protein, partial [Desulfurobacteriaceae bacterium]